jgi:hypothetical protein
MLYLQSVAANLFASSIFPYAAFLYYLTRSKKTPGLALFGFYFLLVFVFATIPAGIYGEPLIFTKHAVLQTVVKSYLHLHWHHCLAQSASCYTQPRPTMELF